MKSHLLPRAFVDKNLDKVARIELGERGKRPSLRYTGWYDEALVTADGEKILAKYDNDAAAILLKLGICWRAFPINDKVEQFALGDGLGTKLLRVKGQNSESLRLFFLSLLWRAVFTEHKGFGEIRLDVLSRNKLTKIVRGDIKGDIADFPVALLLLTTKGQPQNQTPLRSTIQMRSMFNGAFPDVPIFRFFLDGLVAHVGRKKLDRQLLDNWGPRVLGASDDLMLIGRPYEGSFQEMNLGFLEEELDRDWPVEAKKIYGALN
ncbi:hypothetical protein ACWGTO_14700 [Mesorhizobium sp. PL10]